MKILLIDLPIPYFSVNDRYSSPLALGYLKAFAEKNGLGQRCDIEILDEESTNLLSDCALVETIVQKKPEILGFSTYVWNTERTLYVAEQVKSILPGVKIVLGGPEISPDNLEVIGKPCVDILVTGEGEMTFTNILNHFLEGKPHLEEIKGIIFKNSSKWNINPPAEPIANLNEIPSPYLSGIINPAKFCYTTLETKRGCSYNCAYCYYGKGFKSVRDFKLERLEKELEFIKKSGGRYIYIIDSCLNQTPRFHDLCELFKKVNHDKSLEFQVELRAELITEETARSLSQANVKLAEVGLQSTNPLALKKVGRRYDLEKFKKGVGFLKDAGIEVIIGIIIGLPEDTKKGIRETVRFLLDNQMTDVIHIYPLCILPGTKLRTETEKFRIKYLPCPPYFAFKTPMLSCTEIRKSFWFCYETFHKEPPEREYSSVDFFTYSQGKYPYVPVRQFLAKSLRELGATRPISRIVLPVGPERQIEEMRNLGECLKNRITNSFSLHLISKNFDEVFNLILPLIRPIGEDNPYLIWNLILETDNPFRIGALKEIENSIPAVQHYADKLFYFHGKCKPPEVAKRFFVVLLPGKDKFKKGWAGKLMGTAYLYWAVTFDAETELENKLKKISKMEGHGILVDFALKMEMKEILGIIEKITGKSIGDKKIFFRNWSHQWLYNVMFKNSPRLFGTNESMLKFNQKLEFEYLSFNKTILNLDRMEWMLVAKDYGIAMGLHDTF